MRQVPHEIWLHIANFVHPNDLEHLISLNSTFYHIAMDIRYRQLSFSFLDAKMLKNIVRLRDPVVAKRVRILHVYPAFLKQAVDRKESLYNGQRSLRFRFASWVNQVLESKHTSRSKLRILEHLETIDDFVQIMFDVFRGLPNITEYHIMWSGLQPITSVSPVPFLSVPFRNRNLRKLSLDISLENLPDLLAPHFGAPRGTNNIQELDLIIRTDHTLSASSHAQIMIHHLAPFITRLKSSIQKLSIQSWEPLDLSPLFLSLDRLPLLTHLALGIPIDPPHLGDPFGLAHFVARQGGNLRVLSVRVTQYSGTGTMHPNAHVSVDNWIVSAFATVPFPMRRGLGGGGGSGGLQGVGSNTGTVDSHLLPNLRKLEMTSSLFPPAAALTCIHQFSSTITSLVLTGGYFHTLSSVRAVLYAFRDRHRHAKGGGGGGVNGVGSGSSTRLESLRLGTVVLTPALVDLLAEELVGLRRLELVAREVGVMEEDDEEEMNVGWEDDLGRRCSPVKSYNPLEQIEQFICEMERRRYPKWNLRSIKVLLTSIPYHSHHLEQLLAACVPSIRGTRT